MRKSFVRLFAVLTACVVIVANAVGNADVITQWNFNSDPPDANLNTISTNPSTGTGIASLVGGVTGGAGSGSTNGGSSDPAGSADDTGWQTTGYAAQGTNNKGSGVQFLTSTLGYQDITVSYDLRHSNTSSRYEQLQYTLNGGTTWNDLALFDGNAGDTWFNGRSGDLTSIIGANNNANFGIRIVAAFDPNSDPGAYAASSTNYAGTGTWRFDMITVSGTLVPEPSAIAMAGIGLIGLGAVVRRRWKKKA